METNGMVDMDLKHFVKPWKKPEFYAPGKIDHAFSSKEAIPSAF